MGDIISWATPNLLWSLLYTTIVVYDVKVLFENVCVRFDHINLFQLPVYYSCT